MTLRELRDEIVKRGIESAKKVEAGARLRGALKGFEVCKLLTTPKDFERQIERWQRECMDLQGRSSSPTKEEIDAYWEARMVLAQIEFVHERMILFWGGDHVSAQAALQCKEILDEDAKGD